MNNLISLIENARKTKKEYVASTVRIPESLHAFIETLANDLDLTRQETMLKLLEQGAEVAQKTLEDVEKKELERLSENDADPLITSNFHVLNTNKVHSDENPAWMLSKGIAAAFYNPWKWNINRIKENDIVYLYENGKGIVGYGKGTGEVKVCDCDGDENECHYQELQDFKTLAKPLSAADVKKILDRNVVFLRTMSGMPDGQKILDFIERE